MQPFSLLARRLRKRTKRRRSYTRWILAHPHLITAGTEDQGQAAARAAEIVCCKIVILKNRKGAIFLELSGVESETVSHQRSAPRAFGVLKCCGSFGRGSNFASMPDPIHFIFAL